MKMTWIAMAVASSLVTSGCSTSFPRNTPGTSFGQITVGSPRVESRDRLINERREQEAWLLTQLREVREGTYGFAGATSLTSTAFTGAQANVSFDPQFRTDRIVRSRQQQAELAALRDDAAIAGIRNQRIGDIQARLGKGEITARQACDELVELGASCTPKAAASPSTSAPGPAVAPSSTYLSAQGSKLDPPTGTPTQTTLTLSPLEVYQHRREAAKNVQDDLQSLRGDDGHALAGNTLYRLTFDTSVLPDQDTSAWAVVRVRIRHDLSQSDPQQLLDAAASEYLRQVVGTNEAQYRTMINNIKQVCWHQELEDQKKGVAPGVALQPTAWRSGAGNPAQEEAAFRRVFRCASKDMASNSRRALERQLASWSPSTSTPQAVVRGRYAGVVIGVQGAKESEKAFAARQDTSRLWAAWLGEVFERWIRQEFDASLLSCYRTLSLSQARPGPFPYELVPRTSVNASQAPHCRGLQPDVAGFKTALVRNLQSSVYAVTPKQAVQDLSEVSANRKATELLAGLSAIAGSAGVNAAIQTVRANTAQYEAIRHQPLVVGFTEQGHICADAAGNCAGELVFGWLFGPAFSISNDGKSAQFRHMAQQRAVAAELSVPAWLQSLGMTVETSWRKENGEVVRAGPGGQSVASTFRYQVRLPATGLESLDTLETMPARQPQVDQFQYITVEQGEPAAVLITGRHLGHETQVYIGSQQASLVTLLPGNRGVMARFDKIASPSGMALLDTDEKRDSDATDSKPESKADRVGLTLYTADGMVLAGHVVFRKKEQAPAGTSAAQSMGSPEPTAPKGTQVLAPKAGAATPGAK